MSHMVLVTLGTAGDVHPFAATGQALRARGHRVTLIANGHFAPLAARLGLEFVAVGTAEDYERVKHEPDLWHPRKGLGVVWRALEPAVDFVWDWIEQHAHSDMVLVASTLALGARVAHDRLGLPLATIHLAPSTLMSTRAPSRYHPIGLPRWLPPGAVSVLWSLLEHTQFDPLLAPSVNRLRQRLGLPPVRHVLRHYLHSPQCVLLYYPDWFRPDPGDLPPNSRYIGFPRFDEQGLHTIAPTLLDFLQDGPPPLLFTPGSANEQAARFFDHAAAACRALNRRALFVTTMDLPAASLPAGVHCARYVPFSDVLPHTEAIVHHGGIGTCAQGLAAGVRHMVVPWAFDQFDNAERLQTLGVGDWLAPGRSRRHFINCLEGVLESPDTGRAARHWQQRLDSPDVVLTRACEAIENLA